MLVSRHTKDFRHSGVPLWNPLGAPNPSLRPAPPLYRA
jgi:hypothetical protein